MLESFQGTLLWDTRSRENAIINQKHEKPIIQYGDRHSLFYCREEGFYKIPSVLIVIRLANIFVNDNWFSLIDRRIYS